VFLDGGFGQDEAFGDLGVGPALADGDEDFAFAVGEGLQAGVLGGRGVRGAQDPVGVGVQEAAGESRGDDGVAGGDGVDAGDEFLGLRRRTRRGRRW
jgi:hypothetical protein